MPRRNHARRVHAPFGEHPGIGYAEDYGGRQETGAAQHGNGWGEEGRGDMNETGLVQQFVSDRPHTSLLTAFGVGFGLGLLVTLMLNREEESWFERYAPESFHDLPDRFRQAREKVASAVPGSIRRAGESLASHVPSSWKHW